MGILRCVFQRFYVFCAPTAALLKPHFSPELKFQLVAASMGDVMTFSVVPIWDFTGGKVFCTPALQQTPVVAVVMSNIKWCSVAATPPPWLQNKQWQKMDVWMEGQNIHCSLRDSSHIHHGSRECGRSGDMPQELAAIATAQMKMAPGCSGCFERHCDF